MAGSAALGGKTMIVQVSNIGGIEQKTHAVVQAGVDVFLVPSNDAERAAEIAGDRVDVVPVDTVARGMTVAVADALADEAEPVYQLASGDDRPPGLTSLLTPAGLFTGVLSCGFICFLNPWMDRKLPADYRMHWTLAAANVLGGIVFFCLGLRAYWQLGGWMAIALLLATCGVGCVVAVIMQPYLRGARKL